MISNFIHQVAQWHDPLAHWSRCSAAKDSKIRDESGAMLKSIQQDPAFHVEQRMEVRAKVHISQPIDAIAIAIYISSLGWPIFLQQCSHQDRQAAA